MSDHGRAAARAGWRRLLPAVLIAGFALAGSFALVLVALGHDQARLLVSAWWGHATVPSLRATQPVATTTPSTTPPRQEGAAAEPAKPTPDKPSFDIVRVGRDGNAVVAGRAAPNSEVAISDNGKELGHATADARGEFVFVPQTSLAPGGRELTLAARSPDGAVVSGDTPVLVIVPAVQGAAAPGATVATAVPGAAAVLAAPPVVMLTPQDAVPSLLQPAIAPGEPATLVARDRLGLDVVDYDEAGAIRFAGRAPAGAELRVYIDDVAAGDARAGGDGRWTLTPPGTVAPGDHRLRVDQLAAADRVAARVELPFRRASLAPEAVATGRIVVQPRQSLWELARHAYGQGVRYTVIYEANRAQIRDPNLIYPGQVFAIPTGTEGAANPSPPSSSAVR
jgi:nucleoid-associated protein YgaU